MTTKAPVRMLDALTGLRFVAAFLVFVHHSRDRLEIGSWELGSLGGVAVGFFFVLSGFILTHVYGSSLRREAIGAFYKARFARIWPIHAVCLAIFFLLFTGGTLPDSSERLGLLARHVLLVQSWTTDRSGAMDFNGVAWSISVEFFFYACFPFLCLLRRRAFFATYGVILVATVLAMMAGEQAIARDPSLSSAVLGFVHVGPPMRLLEFATGIATARLMPVPAATTASAVRPWRDTALELVAVASVTLGFLLFGPTNWIEHVLSSARHPVFSAYLPKGPGFALPFALTVVVLSRSTGLLARALANRALVFLGEISFSFYMIHALVLMSVSSRPIEDWRVGFAVALAISLAASTILYLTIEVPMREVFLRLLSGDFRLAWQRVARVPRELAGRAVAWTALVVLAAAPFGLRSLDARARSEELAEHLRTVPENLRDVRFEAEALVLGAKAEVGEREIEVIVVYRPEPTTTRRLFIHVAGADGGVLRQFTAKESRFEDEQGRECVLAMARAPIEQIADAYSIGVGFWSQSAGVAKADRGPLSMGGNRLDILKLR